MLNYLRWLTGNLTEVTVPISSPILVAISLGARTRNRQSYHKADLKVVARLSPRGC